MTTQFYAEDLAGLAARVGVPYKDLLVAADLLASDKLTRRRWTAGLMSVLS